MKKFEHLTESLDEVVKAKQLFEEIYYNAAFPRSSMGSTEGERGFSDVVDPKIRGAVFNLIKGLKDDESVVYSDDRKKAEIVKTREVPDYISRGYIVIHEEANVAPVPTNGQFSNSTASDKVSSRDTLLFGKNRKELKNYKGKKFKVSPHIFRRFEEGHARYSRWDSYIEEEDDSPIIDSIKKYSLRNPTKPVVIENCESGEVVILRRRTNDSRLKHNRSK